MKSKLQNLIGGAAVALAFLGVAGAANAGQYREAQVYYGHAPQVVVPASPPVYAQYEGQRQWREPQRDSCAAPRWDPQQRYMPGNTVRRHGELYTARRVSGQVWNVNSPPEWTPNYWRPAHC